MSILKKPYELSVWEDVWNGQKFVEKKIVTIGSSEMTSQSRAFSVNLTTNVNGTKKLSFKIYKQYVDTATGNKVDNPFFSYLVSERKIKLKYKNKWYDFIIKNVSESSSTYLCTFQLEDALVQELSKNGFNVELNEGLMNNSGTAEEIAKQVLQETDWDVKSEAFVQTLEEPLVYLTTQQQITAQSILDPSVSAGAIEGNRFIIPAGKKVLAFYSSCVEKPYRFQFIYIEDLDSIKTDENRIICNKNSQYYIDYPALEDDYVVKNDQYGFTLPFQFNTTTENEEGVDNIVISSKYRGRKYVFSQRSNFIPVLNRYVQEYKNPEGTLFYGFQDTEYISPALVQNIISNNQFKNTSGWTGTRAAGVNAAKAEVSSVYGYFSDGTFVSALDDLSAGRYPVANVEYKPYLKLEFKSNTGFIVNSGPRDNRSIIKNMEKGDEWALNAVCRNAQGIIDNSLVYTLGEFVYTSSGKVDGYARKANSTLQVSTFSSDKTGVDLKGYKIATVIKSDYSKDSFKKHSQVRLVISAPVGVYYLENIELFKAEYDDTNSLILPNEEQANDLTNRVIQSTYNYFLPDATKDIQNADALVPFFCTKNLSYATYRPNYVPGAQKIRMVTAKESNYFNILQSIAETFECWLTFEIERDELGAIQKKVVNFKNYIDNPNYAGFRYGVNLKEIKRTHESKKIVTKLIVKDNSNEFAKNGFCTITRAAANPTGENYLYDFQYYFNMGMLSAREFLDTVYVVDGAIGPDVNPDHSVGNYNLQGYFPRIKQLNSLIDKKNEILLQFSTDLMHYQAKLETATAGYEAAISGIEQTQNDYYQITFSNIGDIIGDDLAERSDIKKLLTSYIVYNEQKTIHEVDKNHYSTCVDQLKVKYDQLRQEIDSLLEHKRKLSQKFFSTYSRFIQEGTWLDEKYVDDELYYMDAQSVMYNSCYPQVAYTIDVVDVSVLQGLEDFTYELGDKTFVEDLEFFGEKCRAEVIVTEVTEDLDDPSTNKIKVQNFKNQFQDLFQKITATVQQAQYNSGSYEKAVALAEANQARKQQFLTDALMGAEARLSTAGQQSVDWGNDGITVKSVDSPCDAIRMIGGAILLSKQDKNGEQQWVTGVTSDGISASLITAGTLNAGEISIMNYDEPIFRWDSFGISAYDATWQETDFGTVISGVNTEKFVRFDKYGIYGINGSVNGLSWHPTKHESIYEKATFALTWEGLLVKNNLGDKQSFIRIGKQISSDPELNYMLVINNGERDTFSVDNEGNVVMKGSIVADSGYIGGENGWVINTGYIGSSTANGSFYIASAADSSSYWIRAHNAANGGGSCTFSVSKTGQLYASGANISGTITTDALTATNGTIKGLSIIDAIYFNSSEGNKKYYLSASSKDSDYYVYLPGFCVNNNGVTIGKAEVGEKAFYITPKGYSATVQGVQSTWAILLGNCFGVTTDGHLHAENVTLSGNITATEGYIGNNKNLRFSADGIYGSAAGSDSQSNWSLTNEGFYLNTNAQIRLGENFSLASTSVGGKIQVNGPFNIKTSGGTGFTFSEDNISVSSSITATAVISRYWRNVHGFYIKLNKAADKDYTFIVKYRTSQNVGGSELNFAPISDYGTATVTIPTGSSQSALVEGIRSTTFHYLYLEVYFNNSKKINIVKQDIGNALYEEGSEYNAGSFSFLTVKMSGELLVTGNFVPTGIGSYTLGADGKGWKAVYATSSTITSSDRNEKNSIESLKDNYEIFFNNLRPVRYKFNQNDSNRYHVGFISQEVEEALAIANIPTTDFAGFVSYHKEDGQLGYGLRYEEFIALNTSEILKLKARINLLEEKISQLEKT